MPGVAHKARLGGVVLDVTTPGDVARVCQEIAERTKRHDVVPIGFLVQEMVRGVELLVGLVDNPIVGPVMTIGLGGALAETTVHHATAVLPLDHVGVRRLIERAGLATLLHGQMTAIVSSVLVLCEAMSDARPTGSQRSRSIRCS